MADAAQIPDEARRLGFEVSRNGDRLHVEGPPEAEWFVAKLAEAKPDILAALDRRHDEDRIAGPAVEDWDTETQRLIAWFRTATPPAEPFELCRGVTILDPARWWRSIEGDIEFGPNGPRARYGAVQRDLRKLHARMRAD